MIRSDQHPQHPSTYDAHFEARLRAHDYEGAGRVALDLLQRLWAARPCGGPQTVRDLLSSAAAGSPQFNTHLAILADRARIGGATEDRVQLFVRGVRMASAYIATYKHMRHMHMALRLGCVDLALTPLMAAAESARLGGLVGLLPADFNFAHASTYMDARMHTMGLEGILTAAPLHPSFMGQPMPEIWTDAPANVTDAPANVPSAHGEAGPPTAESTEVPEEDPVHLYLDLSSLDGDT